MISIELNASRYVHDFTFVPGGGSLFSSFLFLFGLSVGRLMRKTVRDGREITCSIAFCSSFFVHRESIVIQCTT